MGIKITAEQMEEIDRFAEKRAKKFRTTFQLFIFELMKTDFTQEDSTSRYEVRDKITKLAEKYGLVWRKYNTDHIGWFYESYFKFGKAARTGIYLGADVDYYKVETKELAKYIPEQIVAGFELMTFENAKKGIKECILEHMECLQQNNR